MAFLGSIGALRRLLLGGEVDAVVFVPAEDVQVKRPCTRTDLVAVAGCDASSESFLLAMLVPTTSTLVSAVFLVGGVVVKLPPVNPKCSPGESRRSFLDQMTAAF